MMESVRFSEAVIFVGIQASGKSTFYQERFAATHVRINLDILKTRRREDVLLTACIHDRLSFVVDNTNVLAHERAKYIAQAKPAGYQMIGYVFQASLDEALRRNQQRLGKAVVPVPGVIAKYKAFQPPRYSEGFDQLFRVRIDPRGGFQILDWRETDWPYNRSIESFYK